MIKLGFFIILRSMKKVFKLLLLACLIFQLNTNAKEVKLIHITDIDLNLDNASKVLRTVKEINSFKDVDFVVFGGNNLKSANIDNLNAFVYILKKLKKKGYVLLGENDVLSTSGINKEYYLKKVRKSLFAHSKNPNYVFKKNGYVFVAMDGSKQFFKSTNGYYSKKELLWLENVLNKYKNERIVILQHFPLLENSSKWLETAKMEEYQELLNKHKNVKVIISGHYDENIETKKDDIYYIVTEDYSKKGGYKIIEIDLDYDFIATYLVR